MKLVKAEQAEEVAELFHRAYQTNEELGIHFKAATITAEEIRQHLLGQPIFYEEVDGKIVSTVGIRLPWSKNPSPFSLPHLSWVATLPEFQGQSYAKNLIKNVMEIISTTYSAPAVTLGTAVEHPWLISAYKKMGFQYLAESQLFDDHKTAYLIHVFNRNALKDIKDEKLSEILNKSDGEKYDI